MARTLLTPWLTGARTVFFDEVASRDTLGRAVAGGRIRCRRDPPRTALRCEPVDRSGRSIPGPLRIRLLVLFIISACFIYMLTLTSARRGGLAGPLPRGYDLKGELVEQAILALVSFSVMLTLHLDRARRSETRKLRDDMNDGFGALRKEMNDSIGALRAETNDGFGALRKEMRKAIKSSARTISARINDLSTRVDDLSARVDNLNTSVIDLANKVGRVEGRTEVLAAVE